MKLNNKRLIIKFKRINLKQTFAELFAKRFAVNKIFIP